ncbi:hypothetical protein HBB16_19670 [Pseudonocardia sp. MCCB 268]|nr:hypothetical protein [Pseudonocardia cytotoxica]
MLGDLDSSLTTARGEGELLHHRRAVRCGRGTGHAGLLRARAPGRHPLVGTPFLFRSDFLVEIQVQAVDDLVTAPATRTDASCRC